MQKKTFIASKVVIKSRVKTFRTIQNYHCRLINFTHSIRNCALARVDLYKCHKAALACYICLCIIYISDEANPEKKGTKRKSIFSACARRHIDTDLYKAYFVLDFRGCRPIMRRSSTSPQRAKSYTRLGQRSSKDWAQEAPASAGRDGCRLAVSGTEAVR